MKGKRYTNPLIYSTALASLGLLAVFSTAAPSAKALTLIRNFIAPTEVFPEFDGLNGGDAPSNAAGGGNLIDIFNIAADIWEDLIKDDHTVTLNYGWAPLTGKGLHSLVSQGGAPHRETEANILFDNDESFSWFLDSTPHLSEEYQDFMASTQDLGGGAINVERRYSNPISGSAAFGRYDLLQTAIHEIGHALGMSSRNSAYGDEKGDGYIDVTSPLPFNGSDIPLEVDETGKVHAHFSDTLGQTSMWGGGLPKNERRYLSAVDILANSQVSQFSDIHLDPLLEGKVSATFSNPNPGCAPSGSATCTGMGTNTINWGIPSISSGLPNRLSIGQGSFTSELGKTFVAGTIDYFNGSIWSGSGVSEVDLSLSALIDIPTLGIEGLAFSDSRQVTINNTLNTSDPWASADFLSILPPAGANASFANNFHVLEGESATAELLARIVLQDVEQKIEDPDGDIVASGGQSGLQGGDPDSIPLTPPPVSTTPPQRFLLEFVGFGNVVEGKGFVTSSKVPEPSMVLGMGLALGLGGLSIKRKNRV